MDLWVSMVHVYVGTMYHPYVPTNLLVVTIQASCVYTAGTAVELPCMLAAAASNGCCVHVRGAVVKHIDEFDEN